MPSGSHSFAEVLQGRRRSGLFGLQPRDNWSSTSRATNLKVTGRGILAANHASEGTPRITTRDATRSKSTVGATTSSQSMQSAEQLATSSHQAEKRLSEISVITQVRLPSSRHSLVSTSADGTSCHHSESGRSTPRPHTAGAEGYHQRGGVAAAPDLPQERPRTAMAVRSQQSTRAEQSAFRGADLDYHATLRRMEGQDPVIKRSNKLEKMFGTKVDTTRQVQKGRREPSFDLFEDDDDDDDEIAEPPINDDVPPVPAKSPSRPNIGNKSSIHPGHRQSNSFNRSVHNSSVASTTNQDSDLTNPDSDVFSDIEDDASSFTSGLSSLTDELERRKAKSKVHGDTLPAGACTSEGGHLSALRLSTNVPLAHGRNQQLPSPPDAIACYDKLAMRSPTGIERSDFGASRVPDLAKATTSVLLAGNTIETHMLDLSHRPPSLTLSDVSDAESYDSACPPPVSLHRDHLGPKYRSREEQKRAFTPRPKQSSKESPNSSSLALAKSKSHGSGISNGTDLSVRPAQFEARNGSVTSASSDYAGNGTRQGAGFSLSRLFLRKKEKEPEPVLQPLRKITFDSRGQKQVVDLNGSQLSVGKYSLSRPSTRGGAEDIADESLRSRGYSTSTARSASSTSHATHRNTVSAQGSWRRREPGAPRRTAWK